MKDVGIRTILKVRKLMVRLATPLNELSNCPALFHPVVVISKTSFLLSTTATYYNPNTFTVL